MYPISFIGMSKGNGGNDTLPKLFGVEVTRIWSSKFTCNCFKNWCRLDEAEGLCDSWCSFECDGLPDAGWCVALESTGKPLNDPINQLIPPGQRKARPGRMSGCPVEW